jgi:hypothetical protein
MVMRGFPVQDSWCRVIGFRGHDSACPCTNETLVSGDCTPDGILLSWCNEVADTTAAWPGKSARNVGR